MIYAVAQDSVNSQIIISDNYLKFWQRVALSECLLYRSLIRPYKSLISNESLQVSSEILASIHRVLPQFQLRTSKSKLLSNFP